uniref:Uncharacterized protein n=1 Tax=Rhodopseudomonas palustris (strain BisA53) TaxID=316055 RepID=Q07PN1_RHOP5
MGERLKRAAKLIKEQFHRKVQVVSLDHAASRLSRLMEREGLVLAPKPWVTCSCPHTNDAARRAACRQSDRDLSKAKGADFANAGPLICKDCLFAIIEGARTSYVEAEALHLKRIVAVHSDKPSLVDELERMNLIEVTRVLDECYSTAEPLEPAYALREET